MLDGKLHVSANGTGDNCSESWGTKFDPAGAIDPIIAPSKLDPCIAAVSFKSKVSASVYFTDTERVATGWTVERGVCAGAVGETNEKCAENVSLIMD